MPTGRSFRLALFGGLYFTQGAMMSYFDVQHPVPGRFGYGEADIGIFQAVLVVPFVLKIFLGMLSDGVNLFGMGHRKPYIFVGLVLQSVAVLILAWV